MMTDREIIEVVQAHIDGKDIQFKTTGNTEWRSPDNNGLFWQFYDCDYRVKPEPRKFWINKYFSNQDTVYDNEYSAKNSVILGGETIELVEVMKGE